MSPVVPYWGLLRPGTRMQSSGVKAARRPAHPATRIVLRVVVYYAVLIVAGSGAWRLLPHGGAVAPTSLDALFGGGSLAGGRAPVAPLDEAGLALTVAVAML